MYQILIADDEEVTRQILSTALQNKNYQITTAKDGTEASALCRQTAFDIAVLDIRMPGKSGLQVLTEIRQRQQSTTVIVITAFGSIDNAVEAMKTGADDYITKPFDVNEFVSKIAQHLQVRERRRKTPSEAGQPKELFWGNHSSMSQIEAQVMKIKDLNTTILITGESGTGKGMLAKEIHRLGNRKDRPFVHVDCAFLPRELIESELFGHEKGSFTGATSSKKGKFELAEVGIIFLDEIGTLPLDLQAKLLNVLQERCIDKIGGTKKVPMRARVIAATNENMEQNVSSGTFREDLYYRLNVIHLEMPPLRYRKNDIPGLARYFLDLHARAMGKTVGEIEPGFWECLRSYDWPGNVRELENALESALALSDDRMLKVEDLPIRISSGRRRPAPRDVQQGQASGPPLSLEEQEILAIVAALERNNGHREKTAQELGISRRTLQYKLRRFHLI